MKSNCCFCLYCWTHDKKHLASPGTYDDWRTDELCPMARSRPQDLGRSTGLLVEGGVGPCSRYPLPLHRSAVLLLRMKIKFGLNATSWLFFTNQQYHAEKNGQSYLYYEVARYGVLAAALRGA